MKLNKNLLIIVIAFLIIVVAGVFVVFRFVLKPGKPPLPTAAQLQTWQYQVSKITTNLQGSSIIQIQLTLQAPNSVVTNELSARSAQIDNTVISVLHNMSSGIVLEPGGRMVLKDQIMKIVNSYLTSGKITGVYINSLIVQ